MVIGVLDLSGNQVGRLNVFASDVVIELTAEEMFDAIPGPQPPFGALVFDFPDQNDGGSVQGSFSVEKPSVRLRASVLRER